MEEMKTWLRRLSTGSIEEWAGIAVLAMIAVWTVSCAKNIRQADSVDQTGAKNVFTEVTDNAAGVGETDLLLRLSIKTHLPGYYLLESKKSLHGKPGYPFVVTIDGETAIWREDGHVERTPKYDAKGYARRRGRKGLHSREEVEAFIGSSSGRNRLARGRLCPCCRSRS
jgi:hypothetical protein